jgi:hypothetical protein
MLRYEERAILCFAGRLIMSEQLPAEGSRGRQVRDRDRAFMRTITTVQVKVMDLTGGRLFGRLCG